MNALTLEVILRVVFGVTDETPAGRAAAAGQRDRRRQPGGAARLGLPLAAEVRRLEAHRREPVRARPADVRRDPRAPRGSRPRRAHRRALPADPDRRRRRRHRSTTPSCATSWSPCCSPATRPRRPRCPGRSTRSAATASCCARCQQAADDGDDELPRRGDEGVDAAAPGDPDGGADPDEAGHDRRHRRARRRHGRAVDRHRATRSPTTIRTRGSSGPSGSSARTRPPTPGSRSAAASAAASARGSR